MKIKVYCAMHDIKIKDLAKRLGISRNTIYYYISKDYRIVDGWISRVVRKHEVK